MPVEVDIDAEQHTNVVLVPAVAIVRDGEDTAVFVAAEQKAQRREVRIGLTNGKAGRNPLRHQSRRARHRRRPGRTPRRGGDRRRSEAK